MRALFIASIVALAIAPLQARSADIVSYAIVRDDGSLQVRGRIIQLFGIYIPPTGQTCRTYIHPIKCASRAVLALDFKIDSHFVHCDKKGENADGSIIALCRAGGEDLSAWMLERGWAVALPDAPFEYTVLEKIARTKQQGVWGTPVDTIERR